METFEEVQTFVQRKLVQMQAMRKALEASMDEEGSSEWEGNLMQAEPEPTPQSVPPMEEPTEDWEVRRLSEIRAQMRANWPAIPRPLKRRPLPIR